MKVAIIGAGIVGSTAAYYLSKAAQVDVTVYDHGVGQATKAAAGIISPWFSKRRNKAWYRLARLGADFYQELVEDQVEVGFGNAKIYYDNAEMLGDSATLKVEVGFGNAVIYVPQHWRVDLKVETFCGVAKADTSLAPTSKTLIIRGDVAFGKLGIVYVK